MVQNTRSELEKRAKDAQFVVETVRDSLVVGNAEGIKHAVRSMSLDIIEQELSSMKDKLANHEAEIKSLQEAVGAYSTIRHRFISTYKQKKIRWTMRTGAI
jgi:hypothetical protein